MTTTPRQKTNLLAEMFDAFLSSVEDLLIDPEQKEQILDCKWSVLATADAEIFYSENMAIREKEVYGEAGA